MRNCKRQHDLAHAAAVAASRGEDVASDGRGPCSAALTEEANRRKHALAGAKRARPGGAVLHLEGDEHDSFHDAGVAYQEPLGAEVAAWDGSESGDDEGGSLVEHSADEEVAGWHGGPCAAPTGFVGHAVAKLFGSTWHYGYVAQINTELVVQDGAAATQWVVVFEDGDKEDMTREEVRALLGPCRGRM